MNEEKILDAIRCYNEYNNYRKKMFVHSMDYATEKRITYSKKAMQRAEYYGKLMADWVCFFDRACHRLSAEEQEEVWRRLESRRRIVTTAEGQEENPN